jgi:hypothetical protein
MPQAKPHRLDEARWSEMFVWLVQSLKSASRSNPESAVAASRSEDLGGRDGPSGSTGKSLCRVQTAMGAWQVIGTTMMGTSHQTTSRPVRAPTPGSWWARIDS